MPEDTQHCSFVLPWLRKIAGPLTFGQVTVAPAIDVVPNENPCPETLRRLLGVYRGVGGRRRSEKPLRLGWAWVCAGVERHRLVVSEGGPTLWVRGVAF